MFSLFPFFFLRHSGVWYGSFPPFFFFCFSGVILSFFVLGRRQKEIFWVFFPPLRCVFFFFRSARNFPLLEDDSFLFDGVERRFFFGFSTLFT